MKTGKQQSAIVLASLGVLGITASTTVRTHSVVGPPMQESKTYVVSVPDTEQEMKIVVTEPGDPVFPLSVCKNRAL